MSEAITKSGATAQVVDYALNARFEDLPEAVVAETRRAIVNYIGCAIGGSRSPTVDLAERTLAPFAGPEQVTVVGRGRKTDALSATLINCHSSCVYTFDDSHAEAIIHPTGPVAAPALSFAEMQPVNGRDFLLAVALGIEISCRLSKAISVPPAQGAIGWNQTGVAGGIGGAVAVAKLMGLDARHTAWAVGLAVSQACGLRVVQGTMSSTLMPANGAISALRAAVLARGGIESSTKGLEGPNGYLLNFAPHAHLDHLTGNLGKDFSLLGITYKPYPSGIVVNPIIDAALALREKHGIDPAAIRRIRVRVTPVALTLTDRRHPVSSIEAQVSLQHWTAVALTYGTARISDTSMDRIGDPAIRSLRDTIEPVGDDSVPFEAAEVSVELADGTTVREFIPHATGSADRPMTNADLERKFRGLAEDVLSPASVEEVLGLCWRVDELADVADISRAAAGKA